MTHEELQVLGFEDITTYRDKRAGDKLVLIGHGVELRPDKRLEQLNAFNIVQMALAKSQERGRAEIRSAIRSALAL